MLLIIELFVFLLIVLVLFICYIIFIYNSLVRLKNNITKAWSNIEVLLKQRYDELPKLIDTVKGYTIHEKSVLTDLIKIRSDYKDAKDIHDIAEINDKTDDLIKKSFLVFEKYPDLKADGNFLKLQKRISEIENMISDRREYYNDVVTIYNTRIEQIPYNLIANSLKYKPKDLFVANDSEKKNIRI